MLDAPPKPLYRNIPFWLAVLVLSTVLTWWEWVGHHPRDLALVALIHIVFVAAVLALSIVIRRRLVRGR